MATDVDICNLALARVGQRQFIQELDDSTTEAELCSVLYPAARDALLTTFDWPFATKHQVLALLQETRSGWAYAYKWPTDCLKARYIFAGARPGAPVASVPMPLAAIYAPIPSVSYLPAIAGAAPTIPFTIEASDDLTGRIILTDLTSAELIYTAAMEEAAAFVQEFVEALASKLAVDLAMSLAVKPQLAQLLQQASEAALQRAISAALSEVNEDPLPDSSFIAVRG